MPETSEQEFARLGYFVNAYSLAKAFGVPYLHPSNKGWMVEFTTPDYSARYSGGNEQRLSGKREQKKLDSWGEAIAWAEKRYGVPADSWCPVVGDLNTYLPAAITQHKLWKERGIKPNRKDDGVLPWKLKAPVTSPPCVAFVMGDWHGAICGKPTKEGDEFCPLHRNAATKREETRERWQANWDAQRERWDREEQAEKKAQEVLEALTPALVEMGYHPDTFGTNGKGKLLIPPEMLETLVEMGEALLNS